MKYAKCRLFSIGPTSGVARGKYAQSGTSRGGFFDGITTCNIYPSLCIATSYLYILIYLMYLFLYIQSRYMLSPPLLVYWLA